MTSANVVRAMKNILENSLAVRQGEILVIVADEGSREAATRLLSVARESPAEAVFCLMETRDRHAQEPPAPVAAALSAADAAILATTYSLTHTEARRQASARGVRIVSLPGCTDALFESEGLLIDFRQNAPVVERVAAALTEAKTVRVRSSSGTDVVFSIEGRRARGETGVCDRPGLSASPPCVEANVAPVEDSAEGVVVVDGATVPGGLVDEPIVVRIEKGTIVSISGGRSADELKTLLKGYDDPNMFRVAELGIGLNPLARMGRGILTEDEGQYGTVHLGLGEGRTFGSSIRATAHVDLVLRDPVLELDGRVIVENGEVRV